MKLKEGFITYSNGDDDILIDTTGSFSGIIHNNSSASFIVECLKEDITREQLIAKMLEKYDAPENVLAEGADTIIEKLKSVGAIEE